MGGRLLLQQLQGQAQPRIVEHGERVVEHDGRRSRQQQPADGQPHREIQPVRRPAAETQQPVHDGVLLPGLQVHPAVDLHAGIAPAGQRREDLRGLLYEPG